MCAVPVAVLTNGSLLWQPKVRAELALADVVLPSLDAGDVFKFEFINRPHASLSFEPVIDRLISFGREFKGQCGLEVFLLAGLGLLFVCNSFLVEWLFPDDSSVLAISAAGTLSDEDEKLLAATVREASPQLCRLCPTCRADHRSRLPVPEVMRTLMYAEGYGDLPRARKAFANLSVEARTGNCESCPPCTALCPNGVRVRERMLSAQAHRA